MSHFVDKEQESNKVLGRINVFQTNDFSSFICMDVYICAIILLNSLAFSLMKAS